MAYNITTNGRARAVEFSTEDEPTGEGRVFFKYKGEVYFMGDIMSLPVESELRNLGWHGYQPWGAYNGIVIKIDHANYTVVVGYYVSV